jgi:hypothetical protein
MLEWKDYRIKAAVPKSETSKAISFCGFNAKMQTIANKLILNTDARFNKELSWVLKGQENDYLLSHEQGHFDIAEVNARKYRQAITLFNFKQTTFKHDLDSLQAFYDDLCLKEQAQYDSETEKSVNKAEQAKWTGRIMGELETEKNYWDPAITKVMLLDAK